MEHLYSIDVPYACFGIITNEVGKIIDAAPIAKWAIGKNMLYVENYFITKKNGTVEKVY